jgi:ribonuclease BN (tRNA processing enzyme)
MKFCFIGTGHGSATATHMSSVTWFESCGKSYLVDCADGADAAMLKKGISPSQLSAVFITHLHLDHTGGLPVVLKRLFKEDGEKINVILPNAAAGKSINEWMIWNGFGKRFETTPDAINYSNSREGFNDGNVEVAAFQTEHLTDPERPSYAYTIKTEGKKISFTGDLRGDCADFPLEALQDSDLVISELTHFRLHHIFPFLEQLRTKALIFNHIGNWSQVPEEQQRILEKCKELPYPVMIAHDGMEFEL